jgi:hypothetical protein
MDQSANAKSTVMCSSVGNAPNRVNLKLQLTHPNSLVSMIDVKLVTKYRTHFAAVTSYEQESNYSVPLCTILTNCI